MLAAGASARLPEHAGLARFFGSLRDRIDVRVKA
jgi:hypothetical protein